MEERFSPLAREHHGSNFIVHPAHQPVLLEEVIEFLKPEPGKKIVDATIGGGGHAEAILKMVSPGGILIGIDRDSESLKLAHERLKRINGVFELINRNFSDIAELVKDLNIGEVDGVLFDLGISSIQMETQDRGFSIKQNGPLDMRMDRSGPTTAKDLVNKLSEEELSSLIRDYGEDRFHKTIAKAIVSARRRKEISTTFDLAEIVTESLPISYRKKSWRLHPATRTFQAFRIAVNDELSSIENALNGVPRILRTGGRVCVISFHSLEDRIVKRFLRNASKEGQFRILTKKPVTPGREELFTNPRARSAKLRAAIKLDLGKGIEG